MVKFIGKLYGTLELHLLFPKLRKKASGAIKSPSLTLFVWSLDIPNISQLFLLEINHSHGHKKSLKIIYFPKFNSRTNKEFPLNDPMPVKLP